MFYASCLATCQKAISFVHDELGLSLEQATEQQIGFSDRTLGSQLPSKRIKAGREVRELLQELGVYKANGREALRGYVTVPIQDAQGNVIGIRGHKIDKHASGPETILIGDAAELAPKAAKEGKALPVNITKAVEYSGP